MIWLNLELGLLITSQNLVGCLQWKDSMLGAGVFINIGNEHGLFIKSVFWQRLGFSENSVKEPQCFPLDEFYS